MTIPSDLRPGLIVRGALLPEPVKIIATTPIGLSMKLTNINLVERLDSILNHHHMPQEIVDGLGALGGAPESEFEALVERVEGRFEKGRHYPVVLQFIRDDSMLRDDELERLFRFIYNSLVTNFKGELAEALARPSLAEFADILRAECGMSALETIPGHEVRARQGGRRGGLYKWADAVFVRQGWLKCFDRGDRRGQVDEAECGGCPRAGRTSRRPDRSSSTTDETTGHLHTPGKSAMVETRPKHE